MNLLQAIVIGLIQGLGEFLPISSSGHLVIAPWLLDFPDPGLSFDVALHLGTLIAIGLYFWKDFIEIIKNSLSSYPASRRECLRIINEKAGGGKNQQYPPSMFWFIVIATVPGALFGYFLENYAETIFRNPLLVALTLALAGLILYLADRYAKHKRNIKDLKIKDALFIGLSQSVAIIPGISRAGATITAGLFLELDRVSAARFSFLMSAPIIFGATVLKLPGFISHGIDLHEIIAVAMAAFSGYFAINWMLRFIEKVSYKVFFWYRLALAAVIVIAWFLR